MIILYLFYENIGRVVGSNGRGAGGNNGTWVRKNGKWIQEEQEIDEPPVQKVEKNDIFRLKYLLFGHFFDFSIN